MLITSIGDGLGFFVWVFGLMAPVFIFAVYFVVEAIRHYPKKDSLQPTEASEEEKPRRAA